MRPTADDERVQISKTVCSPSYAQSFTQDAVQSWNPILRCQGTKGGTTSLSVTFLLSESGQGYPARAVTRLPSILLDLLPAVALRFAPNQAYLAMVGALRSSLVAEAAIAAMRKVND